MNNKQFNSRTLLVVLAAMTFSLSFVATSCQPTESVRYYASYSPSNSVDTITFEAWSWGNLVRQNTVVFYPTPTEGQYEEIPIYVYHGGKSIPTEVAFLSLSTEYDSVRFSRRSDDGTTITYRHDENATDAQRYFFTRDAWKCDPEGEELKSRTYAFILKDEMFK